MTTLIILGLDVNSIGRDRGGREGGGAGNVARFETNSNRTKKMISYSFKVAVDLTCRETET